MKVSVGLVLLTKLKIDGNYQYFAVLQRRGDSDSWPGLCQVTAHGGLESGETFIQALSREIKEELGVEAWIHITPEITSNMVKISEIAEETKSVQTFALLVPLSTIGLMVSEESSGGFEFVSQSHVCNIEPATKYGKQSKVPLGTIAMFPDEKLAVINSFEKYSGNNS